MTYTEFIIGVENNIAKANCNKLNIGEYEEKQKQIYNQIRADAIDDFAKKMKHEYGSDEIHGTIDEISEQLKIGVIYEI